MFIYFFFPLTVFALSCDASLRGIQGLNSGSKHRKLEQIGRGEPETNEYIVLLNQEHKDLQLFETRLGAVGGKVLRVYRNIFLGVAIAIKSKESLVKILDDEAILMAVANHHVASSVKVQRSPIWGLDRLDEASWPLNNKYQYEFDGTGVHVYILDTGIRIQHREFGGRARCAFNTVGKEPCTDLSSHGTHVAALVGGKNFGVAKNVTLHNVKVLDKNGDGTFADLLEGLDFVVDEKVKRKQQGPMVINLSLNGEKSSIINKAIQAAIDVGITVVVAAGNDRDNSCNYSPGSTKDAITVGATDFGGFAEQMDRRADFSNTGPCVNIFAPGVDITSASSESNLAIRTMSGTSMASPFVAGVAALYLQRDPDKSPRGVWQLMQKDARKGRIELFSASETPNVLVSTKNVISRKLL